MKLQPQDLRLGITLYDSLRNKEIKLELKHFKELSISKKAFFDRYRPVQITNPKLLELGFKEDKEMGFFYKHLIEYSQFIELYENDDYYEDEDEDFALDAAYEKSYYVYIQNDDMINSDDKNIDPIFAPDIKHVHELENLFYGFKQHLRG